MNGMDKGFVEQNIILGDHPSDGAIILHKVIILGTAVIIGHFWPKARLPLFYGLGVIGIYATAYNARQL